MTELKITQADRDAAKRHQQRFLTEGRSETELLWETLARHRIAAEEGKADQAKALENAIGLIAHKMGMEATALVAGQTLVARQVWSQGMSALAKAKGETK